MSKKRLTVHIDDDLALFVREMAHTNGISIQKYTNNLLDKAIILEKGEVNLGLARDIETQRRSIADKTFEDYTFKGITINDHDGWSIASSKGETIFSKSVYYHLPKDGDDTDNHVGTFTVTFTGESLTPSINGDITD